MKQAFCLGALLFSTAVSQATMIVGSWNPLFKGVDQAVGTNFADATIPRQQVVHCVRVDLQDPDVRLFPTPKAPGYIAESRETLTLQVPHFLTNYHLQVAINANWYSANPGGSDPSSENVSCEVIGMMVSAGAVVSAQDSSGDFGGRHAALTFDDENNPRFNFNSQPGGSMDGIVNAVTGYYPVLTNGVNVWAQYYSSFFNGDSNIHSVQPRTEFGVSQDNRYLYLMTIDGRQGGYSDGALDAEAGIWLLAFGAWNAISMDGGGSTSMYMADCAGNPVALNHSSLIGAIGRERIIGAHLGIYALPLGGYITNVVTIPGATTATVTWDTLGNSTSQVEYGLTTGFGTLSTNDPTPVLHHSINLSGLTPTTRYFYRVISSDGTTTYRSSCGIASFVTTNSPGSAAIYNLSNDWRYYFFSLDGVNWQTNTYDDTTWSGHGPGLLWADSNGFNPAVPQERTQLPINPSTTYPYITYYFRTHFNFTNALAGVTLIFSNYVDDGAVFYLNGVEMNRLYLPTPAFNSTLANNFYCKVPSPGGDATCPYVFSVGSDNLRSGDNVVAVEVHNFSATSHDVVFGQALLYIAPIPPPPTPPFLTNVVVIPGENSATITWTTLSNSTSQVQYGLTSGLDLSSDTNSSVVTSHSVTLTGLLPLTNYFFRVISSFGSTQYTSDGVFSTVHFYVDLVSPTNFWAYHNKDIAATGWQMRGYDESLFPGIGVALFYVETNPAVAPRNTALPLNAGALYPTYYFRSHFTFNTNLLGLVLTSTNYIDDGAVFYLNGAEIQRVRMPAAPQAITYNDFATGCPHPVDCDAVTNAPDIFRLSGDVLTNLIAGADNVFAAEVHQQNPNGGDVVFGSSLGFVRALASETTLRIGASTNGANVSWDTKGLTLQQTTGLGGTNTWMDVPGPVQNSPYVVSNLTSSVFYRLRN
jgi:hypothetical protein